jgi:hypothetical protein
LISFLGSIRESRHEHNSREGICTNHNKLDAKLLSPSFLFICVFAGIIFGEKVDEGVKMRNEKVVMQANNVKTPTAIIPPFTETLWNSYIAMAKEDAIIQGLHTK